MPTGDETSLACVCFLSSGFGMKSCLSLPGHYYSARCFQKLITTLNVQITDYYRPHNTQDINIHFSEAGSWSQKRSFQFLSDRELPQVQEATATVLKYPPLKLLS